MKKKILILMSSYNGERFIEQQIRSIFNQTIADQVTLRIRDDGSSDNTVGIIQMQKEFGNRIELVTGENIGYNASFIKLINGASGYDYYAFSDQDDIWLESKLEEAVKALDAQNAGDGNIPILYASTSYLVYDDLKPYGQTRRKQRPFTLYNTAIQNICPGHTQVMNGALIKLVQSQNLDAKRIYVYDSWITNMAALYGKILYNNSSFTFYRQHKGNQLGSGVGKIGQIFASIKRDNSGDGHKYRRQVEYLIEMNKEELKKQGYYYELKRFINARTVGQKIRYLRNSKLYRQNRIETALFELAVFIGKY